jgi:hypothetical protein
MVSCILKGLKGRHVHQVFIFIFWYWLVIVKTLNLLALSSCIASENHTTGKDLGHGHGDFRNTLGVMGALSGSGK